jgi:copper chaperone CopZ
MAEKTVKIPDISCGHCVNNIKRETSELAGVTSVEGDAPSKTMTFKWDAPADWDGILAKLKEIGYPPA